MISPLQIALQGLAPGASPVTIATQGVVISIEPAPAPAPEQADAQWIPLRSFGPPDATPYDSRKRKSKRIDAVVEVTGCQGILSCTPANVRRLALEAKIVPILAAHCLQYWRWKKKCRQKAEPEVAASRAQTAAKKKAKHAADRAADRAAKILRDDANAFAAALKPADLPNIARMLYVITQENRELRKALKAKTS